MRSVAMILNYALILCSTGFGDTFSCVAQISLRHVRKLVFMPFVVAAEDQQQGLRGPMELELLRYMGELRQSGSYCDLRSSK